MRNLLILIFTIIFFSLGTNCLAQKISNKKSNNTKNINTVNLVKNTNQWNEFVSINWETFGTIEYTCIGLITICGTFLAYLFNVYGIKILGASVAGAYIYLQPFFAAAIAMFFLGEQLSVYKIIAAVFIFAGVYLATKTKNNA